MTLKEEQFANIDIDERLERFLSFKKLENGSLEVRFPTFFNYRFTHGNGNQTFIPLNAVIRERYTTEFRIRRTFTDWRLKIEMGENKWILDHTGTATDNRDDEDGDGKGKGIFLNLLQGEIRRFIEGEQYRLIISYVDYVENGIITGNLPGDPPGKIPEDCAGEESG